jgi:hypothetical protein
MNEHAPALVNPVNVYSFPWHRQGLSIRDNRSRVVVMLADHAGLPPNPHTVGVLELIAEAMNAHFAPPAPDQAPVLSQSQAGSKSKGPWADPKAGAEMWRKIPVLQFCERHLRQHLLACGADRSPTNATECDPADCPDCLLVAKCYPAPPDGKPPIDRLTHRIKALAAATQETIDKIDRMGVDVDELRQRIELARRELGNVLDGRAGAE